MILGAYDFAHANKLFCYNLLSCPAENKSLETPHSAFLSFTSYILHHAYRSARASLYGLLSLSILRIIVEDQVLCKRICTDESLMQVRLCRQRQPFLPPSTSPRPAAAQILDITIDTINHNLHKRLDVDLYVSSINLVHRLLCGILHASIRLKYHWSLLWQSLLGLLRFLTSYASDLSTITFDIHALLTPLLKTITLTISTGNSFLPDPAAYDDLIYKLVENGTVLTRFQNAYNLLSSSPKSPIISTTSESSNLVSILISVSSHYTKILDAEALKGKVTKNLSPYEVSKIIRKGYETLDVPSGEGLDRWERWREGNEKSLLKKVGRCAVEDGKNFVRNL